MKKHWKLLVGPVTLISLISISSCASHDAALRGAGKAKGVAAARVTLPNLPGDCRVLEPHAPVVAGAEARSIIIRERAALTRQNSRTGRCAAFYDGVKRGLISK